MGPQVRVVRAIFSQPKKPNLLGTLPYLVVVLAVIGAGMAPAARASGELQLTPGAVNFGQVAVGRAHTVSVTIANTGNSGVRLSGDTVTGSGYSVQGLSLPHWLHAGSTMTFTVKFTPQNAGTSAGTLKLISNAANGTVAVSLTGLGVSRSAGYVAATPLTAQFGNVAVGTKNTQGIQLTNTGSSAVTISSVATTGSGFSVSGITTPYALAAGASAQLTVAFQPASAGSASGAVTIASTAADSSVSIAVSGTGTATSRLLSVSPGSVAFGNVAVGASTAKTLTVTSAGNSSVTISSDAVSGAGMALSGIAGGTTLAPGQSATLTATFAPKAAGSVSGSITIASNATSGASMTLPATGMGTTTVSHSVALKWQASSSSGVSGYNVYRATAAGGPYTKLDSAAISGTSYTDSSVSSGTTYFYAVTTLGTDGTESAYSNQATAVIP